MIDEMTDKPNSDQASKKQDAKESKDRCQGGYGYMKRRLGLLSFEADQITEKESKPSK